MKQKDMYTLEELYDNLKISLSKLSKMADINEGTLIRIRKGKYSVRKTTVNKLLDAFSEVYGIDLSLDNVTGITLEDKKALHSQKDSDEKAEKPPVPTPVQSARVVAEQPPKRVYTRKKDTDLPAGCLTAIDFGRNHGVKRETFRDHMQFGLGPGLIGESTNTIPERDHVAHETRPKPGREHTGETERYLTTDQQAAAIRFWRKWNVSFTDCNQAGCYCHTNLEENN